jgi:hypothetical protein
MPFAPFGDKRARKAIGGARPILMPDAAGVVEAGGHRTFCVGLYNARFGGRIRGRRTWFTHRESK